jgi:hypothetical protein
MAEEPRPSFWTSKVQSQFEGVAAIASVGWAGTISPLSWWHMTHERHREGPTRGGNRRRTAQDQLNRVRHGRRCGSGPLVQTCSSRALAGVGGGYCPAHKTYNPVGLPTQLDLQRLSHGRATGSLGTTRTRYSRALVIQFDQRERRNDILVGNNVHGNRAADGLTILELDLESRLVGSVIGMNLR